MHTRILASCSVLLLALAPLAPAPAGGTDARWDRLDEVANATIASKDAPGVVFLVSHRGKTIYKKAFGNRAIEPATVPMTTDTIFDLASLTKVVATTSSVMALIEEGKLRPNDPVSRYWPEFAQNGKEKVTIRQLLTHTSGFSSWQNFPKLLNATEGPAIQDHTERVMTTLAALPLASPSDTKLVYSDVGFITLGEIVRRVSGETVDKYAAHRIFAPLKMRDTGYNPGPRLQARTAPTTMKAGAFLQGQVHDPNAAIMGGVAGHAGLFSTADDLARFGKMLLSSDGEDEARYPLAPATVREMTTPHTPETLPKRGLGWDIDSPYSHVRGDLMPVGSFGHTGFTGTFIWVDPYSQTVLIGLSNRVHPNEKGNVLSMWAKASNITAGIVRPQSLPPRRLLSAP